MSQPNGGLRSASLHGLRVCYAPSGNGATVAEITDLLGDISERKRVTDKA